MMRSFALSKDFSFACAAAPGTSVPVVAFVPTFAAPAGRTAGLLACSTAARASTCFRYISASLSARRAIIAAAPAVMSSLCTGTPSTEKPSFGPSGRRVPHRSLNPSSQAPGAPSYLTLVLTLLHHFSTFVSKPLQSALFLDGERYTSFGPDAGSA